MPSVPHVSESEWEVMEILWTHHPLTASDVIKALSGKKGWKDNTVKTLLARLVQKNALTYKAEGNRYLYSPVHSRQAFVQIESNSFLQRVFGGAAQPLLLHFASNAKLSPEEASELRKLLAQNNQKK